MRFDWNWYFVGFQGIWNWNANEFVHFSSINFEIVKNESSNFPFLDSPYRTSISQAILILKEKFVIHNLTEKWWKTNNVNKDGQQVDCSAGIKEESDTPELDMDAVGGIFLVLAIGLALAILVGILEFIWSIRRVSIEERVGFPS